MSKSWNRREFIQQSTLLGVGLSASQTTTKWKAKNANEKMRIGIMGSGLRGQWHTKLLLDRNDCEVVAVAEIDQKMIQSSQALFSKKAKKLPTYYSEHEESYLQMLEKESLDAVIIASPWRWHTPMALASMEAGVFVGMEVCGAFSIDECWSLVNTHERTGTPLFFLENVCYRRDVMAVLNMVKKGIFGELIHLEGGYQHDLRQVKFNDGKDAYGKGVEFGAEGFSESKWRTVHSQYRNGDLYPTHGVGPVAQYLEINRGNRFVQLSSMASKARGLHNYIAEHPKGGSNHKNAALKFELGDKVTTLIKCSNGETITLHHDTNLPRPYSLAFRVQGTKGLWMADNKSIYIEGKSKPHQWEEAKSYLEYYDHPIWKKGSSEAEGGGHGGMDFFLIQDFMSCAKGEKNIPFDVYDAASWLSITPLSEQSIESGGGSISFPDFTRGRWMFRTHEFGNP